MLLSRATKFIAGVRYLVYVVDVIVVVASPIVVYVPCSTFPHETVCFQKNSGRSCRRVGISQWGPTIHNPEHDEVIDRHMPPAETPCGVPALARTRQVDLGLIAVGTAQSGTFRLRNVGTVPLAFALAQAAAGGGGGTVAEAAAAESRTASLLRDRLLSQRAQKEAEEEEERLRQLQLQQNQQRQRGRRRQQQHRPEELRPPGEDPSAAGRPGPLAAAAATATGAEAQHAAANDRALAMVFGASPPPLSPPAAASNPPAPSTLAPGKGLLQRKNSEGSVGSADSFSVSRDGCWLGFEPAMGELSPGRSVTITVS